MLIRFVTWAFFQAEKSANQIVKSLSAVRSALLLMQRDISAFDDERLAVYIRGCRKKDRSRTRPLRVPITVWCLARFLRVANLSTHAGHSLFGALVVGHHGLLRASEFVSKTVTRPSLLRRHVSFETPVALPPRALLFIAQSKTDVFHEGATVALSANGGDLCPVRWLREVLANAPRKDPDAAVFQRADGSPASYDDLQAFIKALCASAGLDSARFSTHSLRIGGATTLMKLGFAADAIQKLGRWVSDSYKRYLRFDPSVAANVSAALAQAAGSPQAPVWGGHSLDEASTINSTNFVHLFQPNMAQPRKRGRPKGRSAQARKLPRTATLPASY